MVTGENSKESIRKHYDLGNAFYRLWLGPTMAYSCALYEDGDALDQAQTRKIDYLIRLARAHGAKRVVDIGCGWGSAARRLLEAHAVEKVIGVNVSEEQLHWIGELGDPRIETHLESWSVHKTEEPYDALISCGQFEHVSKRGVTAAQRLDAYKAFFSHCYGLLKPGASMALQTIGVGHAPLTPETTKEILFLWKEIFTEADLPRIGEIVTAVDKLFEVTELRNDRLMYARTCADWLAGLQAKRAEASALVGEVKVAKYERYLAAITRLMEGGQMNLLRFGLTKVG